MFTRFKHTAVAKAEILGQGLFACSCEVVAVLFDRLETFGEGAIKLKSNMLSTQLLIEFMVFFMHLVDRSAFSILGPEKRRVFADRYMIVIVKAVIAELSKEVSADDFCNSLRSTYNDRQLIYSRYRELIPVNDEPLKGTLYWEFRKILAEFLDHSNPATVVYLNCLVADFAVLYMVNAAKVEAVLMN